MADTGPPEGSAPNKFTSALQAWAQIDLPSLQQKLDEQGHQIKEEQKASLLSRKTLAGKTKEFKKLPDEEKPEAVKALLKLYQNEIDSLTTKRTNVEKHFFAFYRVMAEAPNPQPLLEASLDTVAGSQEAEAYKKEIDSLKDELARRADYDKMKQRMLHAEQKAAETLSAKLAAKDAEYQALIDEKETNWAQKEKGMHAQLAAARNTIEELRTSKEVTELQLSSQSAGDNSGGLAAVLAELEMATRDAEFSKKRVIELENRNETLRRDVSALKSQLEDSSHQKEAEGRIYELEGENARALASLAQLRSRVDESRLELQERRELYERKVQQLGAEVRQLKQQAEATSDYHEVKQELHFLRQLEFGTDNDADENGDRGGTERPQDAELDSLLMQRNKALTRELADIRAEHDGLVEQIRGLETAVHRSAAELQTAHAQNERLERDLQEAVESHRFNDNASMILGVSRYTRYTGSGPMGGAAAEDSPPLLILPIVTKQRDRFRDRCTELEDEVRKHNAVVGEYKRQTAQLKRDNEELYERTRYLAAHSGPAGSSSAAKGRRFQPRPNADIDTNPYRQAYETKLHPMEQFRVLEQERISLRLSPAERLFILLTRAVLATRVTRMLFLVYIAGLHLVVMFVTIYAMSLNTAMIHEVGLQTSTGGVARAGLGGGGIAQVGGDGGAGLAGMEGLG